MSADDDTPVGPPDARETPRFAGPDTFARLPRLSDVPKASVALVGIPFDAGVSYRPGARFGPGGIRAGSKLLRPYHPFLDVEPWTVHQVVDAGDIDCNPFDIPAAVTAVERAASELLGQVDRIITLGGDHTMSLPLLRAHAAKHGPDLAGALRRAPRHVGHLLRHALHPRHSLPPSGGGGCPGAGHVRACRDARPALLDRRHGAGPRPRFRDVTTMDVAERGVGDAIDRVLERVGDRPVYVSVDIDVLDPAHAPGTGTPEPGGLTTPRAAADPARPGRKRHHRRRGRHGGGAGLRPRRAHDDRRRQRGLRVPGAVRALS